MHGIGHCLCRLAKRDGQDTGGKRIKRAAMTCLCRGEDAPHDTDGPRGAEPHRLVEDHPAMNRISLAHRHQSPVESSRRMLLNTVFRRAAVSKVSSRMNFSRGTRRR